MQREQDKAKKIPASHADAHQPFDEADWVDWDHWQTVEELQDFMNDLADETFAADFNPSGKPGESGQGGRIARQIRRHGLEIEW